MQQLTVTGWVVAIVSGLLVGLSKSGLPGVVTIAIVALANVMPAKESVGFLLPILLAGDVCAVWRYRKEKALGIVARLMPCTLAGIAVGYLLLGRTNDAHMRKIIGVIVIALLALERWTDLTRNGNAISGNRWFARGIGAAAGVTTVLGNAASPLIILYLSAMRVGKEQFVAANAWYFLTLNTIKLPLFTVAGLITTQSLAANLVIVPFVVLGSAGGAYILKRIAQESFMIIARLAALAGAIKLLLT